MNWIKTFWILIIGFTSCSEPTALDSALKMALGNRMELEKVLLYYNTPEDSLKHRAACFLIENMPLKYSTIPRKLKDFKSLLVKTTKNSSEDLRNEDELYKLGFSEFDIIYDIHVITADYLIENIDYAFEVWEKPWNNKLLFDDFCELILPYRIADEPLTNWRKLYHNKYASYLDSLYTGTDVVEACNILARKLKQTNFYYYVNIPLPRLDAIFLLDNSIGSCREICDISIYTTRACGIPTAIDYFIYSPEYQHGHTWNVVRDSTDQYLPFVFTQFDANRKKFDDERKKGKVYRDKYSIQTPKMGKRQKEKTVLNGFKHPFRKDVTDNYTGKNKIEVPLFNSKPRYVYLGIFSPKGWIPVDVGVVKNKKAVFHNIEPALIYQPLSWDRQQYIPAGYPFIFSGGEIHIFKPDKNQLENAVLTRKMSLVPSIRSFLHRNMIGVRIEGSNTLSFKESVLFYQNNDTLITNYNEVIPWDHTPCRYIRYKSPPGKQVELAELFLYNEDSSDAISKKTLTELTPVKKMQFINDGDILSYFHSRDTSCYVDFDLGTTIHINKIVFYPRNDDNYVCPGDMYELFYQDGLSNWRSLGKQIPEERKLHYEVPQNAVLWLRNLTKGKEEQIFIYKNGKQVFNVDFKNEPFR